MMIRILNPVVGALDIAKATGRASFATLMTNKGVSEWSFDAAQNIFYATIPDTYDLTKLAVYGTVQKAIVEVVGWA